MIQPAYYQGLGELIPASPFRTDWMFVLTIIPVVLLLINSSIDRVSPANLVKTALSHRFAYTAYRGAGVSRQVIMIPSWLMILMSISTFVWFWQVENMYYPWNIRGFSLWALDFAFISGAIILRYIASSVTGEISGNRELFREYMFNLFSFYSLLGIILVVVNFLIPYLVIIPSWVLITSVSVLTAILYILRTFRLVSIFIRGNFSLLYLILYLCALEFTPILIFIKYLSGTV